MSLKVAVVGHSEWVTFAKVPVLPEPGEILHAQEFWDEAAGGGAVAAVELARLAGEAHFFTARGEDEIGDKITQALSKRGVIVHAAREPEAHTRAFVYLDSEPERTITVLGKGLKPRGNSNLPWEILEKCDAVYFASGDSLALKHARTAKKLVATSRALNVLQSQNYEIDALVRSARDSGEHYSKGALRVTPRLLIATEGIAGGSFEDSLSGKIGRYVAHKSEAPFFDTYGAGDSFAAGLTYALALNLGIEAALHLAAKSGALAISRRGALGEP